MKKPIKPTFINIFTKEGMDRYWDYERKMKEYLESKKKKP